jgi:flagellar basal body-associated protein FliL
MFSKDGKTRLTTVIFWTSVILLLVVGKTAARKFSEVRHFQKYGMNEAQLANKQRLEALALAERERKANVIQTTLGDFNFELVPEPGHSSKRGILNNAEIEIVVVCESREICDTILKRITEARNEITNALTPLGREELLSRDGKKRVKRTVVERLNKWLGQDGLVIDIFFNRFVIT